VFPEESRRAGDERCGTIHLSPRDVPLRLSLRHGRTLQWLATGEPCTIFLDNNPGSDREHLRRLCRALQAIERIWSAAVSIDVTDDPSLVREMALAGCTGVFVGFDHDGPDVFARTVAWLEENRLETEGRILHREWGLYDTAHVVFRPARMTEEELSAGRALCYERLFSHASIWRRRHLRYRRGPAAGAGSATPSAHVRRRFSDPADVRYSSPASARAPQRSNDSTRPAVESGTR